MQRPDDYYVTASIGVPVIALALVGLPGRAGLVPRARRPAPFRGVRDLEAEVVAAQAP